MVAVARAPELNVPVENIWQFLGRAREARMRDNWLSNRIFKTSDDDIVGRWVCCEAWNRLIDQPWKIMSIGLPQNGPMGSPVINQTKPR